MQKTLRAAKLGLLLGIASLLVLLATPGLAKADYYAFWGYDPTTGLHGLTLAKPDGTESPHPLRWWPPPGYTTISTWYKLGSSLDADFKSACRAADSAWDSLWGSGTKYFWFYEDTTPIVERGVLADMMST